MERTLLESVSDRAINQLWWMNVIEATLALFFGISAVFWPTLTLVTLVYLFSAFVLGIGIFQLINGLMSIRARSSWWVTALVGVIGIGVGIYLFRHPNVSFSAFVLVVGLFLIARGILDLVRVFSDRSSTATGIPRILMGIVGVLAILAGIYVLVQPVSGGIGFVWALGVYAIVFGTLNMAVALDLREALEVDREEERQFAANDQRGWQRVSETKASSRGRKGAQPV